MGFSVAELRIGLAGADAARPPRPRPSLGSPGESAVRLDWWPRRDGLSRLESVADEQAGGELVCGAAILDQGAVGDIAQQALVAQPAGDAPVARQIVA